MTDRRKKGILIGGIALFSIMLVLVILYLIHPSGYSSCLVLSNDGYVVNSDKLTVNLMSASASDGDKEVQALPVSASDIVYKKGSKYYVSDQKHLFDSSYPIFYADGVSLLDISGKSSLISDDFEALPGYLGLIVNKGLTFNLDLQRAYREQFILMKIADAIYMNSVPIQVSGNLFPDTTVPVNSVIRFSAQEIRYYSLNGDKFVLSSLEPMSESVSVTINGKTYRYYDLLKKLGIDQKAVSQASPAGSSSPTTSSVSTVAVVSSVSEEETLAPSERQTAVNSSSVSKVSSPSNSVGHPAQAPEQAAPADDAPVAPPVPRDEPSKETDPDIHWEKPVVTLNDFVTTVYTAKSAGMTVEHPEFVASSGILFQVYDNKDNLVMSKSYNGTSDIDLEPLRPDTEFHIAVTLNYIDSRGARLKETLGTFAVHTKPISDLAPLELNWSNGPILRNAVNIQNIQITNAHVVGDNGAPSENTIETVNYLSRSEVTVLSQGDNAKSNKYQMQPSGVLKLADGVPIQFESNANLNSDTVFQYTYSFYDRFGNILPQKNTYAGQTHTSKKLPQAQIKLIKNEVKNAQIGFSFTNPDQTSIGSDSLYFTVYDSNNNPVGTSVIYQKPDGSYPGSATQSGMTHPLSEGGANVMITNLTDFSVYTVVVYGSCDVNDGAGMQPGLMLGQSKFSTVSLSTLGKAAFTVSIQNLTDHSADVQISYDKSSTDPRLISLITRATVSFTDAGLDDGSGISLTYGRSGTDGNVGLPASDGSVTLQPDDIAALQADGGSLTFHVDNLKSMNDYNIEIMPKVDFGSGSATVTREVSSYYKPNSFKTLKKTPVIQANAIYASSDFIRLYGVKVYDPDGAVVSYPVTMAVFDSNGSQIATYGSLSAKGVSTDFNITGLMRDQTYVLRFYASEYNAGYDMSSQQQNTELFYEDNNGNVIKPLQITTREAISGSIQVQGMNGFRINQSVPVPVGSITSTTGVPLASNKKHFNSNGASGIFKTTVDFGNSGINSVRVQYSNSSPTEFLFYLTDPSKDSNAAPFADVVISDSTLGGENFRWTDTTVFSGNKPVSGLQTVYVKATALSGSSIHYLWGLSFDSVTQSGSGQYYANLNAVINDPRLELGDLPGYTVRVYKNDTLVETREHDWVQKSDGSYTLMMYQLKGQNKTLVDSVSFSGSRTTCNANFYYKVDSYSTYRFEIYTTVFGYQIQIGKEEFYTDKPIIGLRTEEDLRNIAFGMDKRYFALNDIATTSSANNIGGSTQFTGELDFRGHTLTYASTGVLFQTVGSIGKIQNMIFTYQNGWGSDQTRLTNAVIGTNNGRINNFMLIRNNGNTGQGYLRTVGGLVNTNTESGVIENFVVKLQGSMIGTNYFAPVCFTNRGLIRQGYVYGSDIRTVDQSAETPQQYAETLRIGGVVAVNRTAGIIEDVFSTIDLNVRQKVITDDTAQGIAGYNAGIIRDSFFTGNVYYGGGTDIGFGPAYRNYSPGSAANVYYSSDQSYGSTDNTQIAKKLLYYSRWYSIAFGDQNGNVPFNLSPLEMKCYPQVNWPWLMPQQEYVQLPALTDSDAVRLLSANVTSQQDETAEAMIIFHNPQNLQITGITSQWLNFQVESQRVDGNYCLVTARITLPAQTKYFSSYLIDSFSYSYGIAGLGDTVTYAAGQKPSVNAEFYKPVQTVQDWAAIKNDYSQNYRLARDLNFNYFPGLAVLANTNVGSESISYSSTTGQPLDTFTGKLDGAGHTVNFGDFGVSPVNTYDYIFGKMGGTVKNLVIQNLNLTGTGAYKGFIARMLDGSVVDNVQVYNVKGTSNGSLGAIAGTMRTATITNSSAHNVVAYTSKTEDNYQYMGGLVGRQSNGINSYITIQNCYVDGLELHMDRASDCMGVGGLVGQIRSGADISHVYVVNGSIDTSYKNAGGLIGAVDTYGDDNASMYQLSQFYVDVDIRTKTERAGGVVGFSGVADAEKDVRGLVLGDVTSNLSGANMVSRYYGNTDSNTPKNMYGYDQSRINGILNTQQSDLFSYAQLCGTATYTDGGALDWDADFARNHTEDAASNGGILPKLTYINGSTLLPGQTDYVIRRDEVQITNISSRPYTSGNLFVVDFDVTHPAGEVIQSASFDSLLVANLADENAVVITPTSDTTTHLRYIVSVNGYYDNYYLTGLTYTKDGGSISENVNINTGIPPQYLNIASAADWNREMTNNGQKGYNVRITGDLDFGDTNHVAAGNVNIASLIGSDPSAWHTIKGITLNNQTQSLVDIANGRIAYLNFQDINITQASGQTPGGFGLFRVTTGDLHDLRFQNITLKTQSAMFTGISALAYGSNYNVTLQDINVTSTYTGSASDFACGGFVGRLSGAGSLVNSQATNVIVLASAQKNTGGLVGAQYQGRYLNGLSMTNVCVSNLTATSSSSYVGGIVGYASDTALANSVGDLHVRQAAVMGGSYVGGIVGASDFNMNTAGVTSTADNVFVAGVGNNAGGVTGRGGIYRGETHQSVIYGNSYVGGVTGDGGGSLCATTDSVVGTVYDRNSGDTVNTIFQAAVSTRQNYYNGLNASSDATQAQKNVYVQAAASLGNLVSTSRINSFKVSPSGSNGIRVGGITARAISIYNCTVANSTIGSYLSNEVGGIVGAVEGPAVWSYNPYRIIGCAVQSSTVRGANKIGGIAGGMYRDYIDSCYSNAAVVATGSAAGGIAGYVQASSGLSLSETPYIAHVYFAGSVTAADYAAGIVGQMGQYLFGTNEGWIMLGNVNVTTTSIGYNAQFLLNKQANELQGTTKAGVYTGSTLTHGLSPAVTAQSFYTGNPAQTLDNVRLVTTSDLNTQSNYASLFGWAATLWNYNGLPNGYMPYVTQYTWANSANVMFYQEGYALDTQQNPVRDLYGGYVYQYQKYTGGVPIPGGGVTLMQRMSLMMAAPFTAPALPKPVFYAVDADRLNIEFPQANAAAGFEVSQNGRQVASGPITQRTFTLAYPFDSELQIRVYKGSASQTYTLWPQDVIRSVMTWGTDYYYLDGQTVAGSPQNLPRQDTFVNLYAGHALDASGNVYDPKSGEHLRTTNTTGLLARAQPLYTFEYDGNEIDTYDGYSTVNGEVHDGIRLYVKDGSLSAMTDLTYTADSIILDAYDGKEYSSVLSEPGTIIDMTAPLTKTKGFVNSNIAYMTNDLNSTAHLLLVRYKNGAVAGFNYLTGEALPVTSPRAASPDSGAEAAGNRLSANIQTSYQNIQKFIGSIAVSGWSPANGSGVGDVGGGTADASPAVTQNKGFTANELVSALRETLDTAPAGHEEEAVDQLARAQVALAGQLGLTPSQTAAVLLATEEQEANLSASDASSLELLINRILRSLIPQQLNDALSDATDKIASWGVKPADAQKVLQQAVLQALNKGMNPTGISKSITGAMHDMEAQGTAARTPEDLISTLAKELAQNISSQITGSDKYLSVYDAKQKKFVLYNEDELLSHPAESLKSVNDQIAQSGHLLEYRSKRSDALGQPDSVIIGYILISILAVGIGMMVAYLLLDQVFKRRRIKSI